MPAVDVQWTVPFDPDTPLQIDHALPPGALAVAGTMDWLRGTESFALTVTTPEPLHYDAGCDAAQRFDAGEVRAAGPSAISPATCGCAGATAVTSPASTSSRTAARRLDSIDPGPASHCRSPAASAAPSSSETSAVEGRGDLAFSTGEYTATLTPKKAGAKPMPTQTGKYIGVMKKQPDGSWKLIYDIWNESAAPKH